MQEDNEFYDYLVENLTFCPTFLLSLSSFFICCHKVCEFFQTLIRPWLKNSLKQLKPSRLEELALPKETITLVWLLKTPKLVVCSPKPSHRHKLICDNLGYLLPPLMHAFVIGHGLTKLPMDLSTMWCLHWVSWNCHKVLGNIINWHAFEIVKYHNVFYHHTVTTQGLLKFSFKQRFQFEIKF